jgi:hypothetical protein
MPRLPKLSWLDLALFMVLPVTLLAVLARAGVL